MTAEPVRLDRRQLRREETIEQVIDVAIELMAEHGASGLTLGDVARRMGMRTPSLYVYFPSKNALYDAVFARGWREVGDLMTPLYDRVDEVDDLERALLAFANDFVGWFVAHPGAAQLMIWRPVPGYRPSAEAYLPAVGVIERSQAAFVRLHERGLLRADVDPAEALRVWTVVTSGVATQQLSNAPDEPFEEGSFTRTLPTVAAMFAAHFGTPPPTPRKPRGNSRRSDR